MSLLTDALPRCWFHMFGGVDPCSRQGRWRWPNPPEIPGRQTLLAMRWCEEHRHATDVFDPNDSDY